MDAGRGHGVAVLLDPSLGWVAAGLRQELGPQFTVVVPPAPPPASAAPPRLLLAVLATTDPATVAWHRRRNPRAGLLVVSIDAARGLDPGVAGRILDAGADDVLASMSIRELAARLQALARRLLPPAGPSAPGHTPAAIGGRLPSARAQVLARLARTRQAIAVGAIAAFAALAGLVSWGVAHGPATAAPTQDGTGVTTRPLAPQGDDGFFDGQGRDGGYGFGASPGSGAGSGRLSPPVGSSRAS